MDHRIIFADVLDGLRSLESESINCVATSPPYWGLRDYGAEGQIGLEATPEAYVARLVEVFAEVRRVLREDGTLWLNLGDSFTGNASPGGEATRTCSGRPNARDPIPTTKRGPGLKPKDLCGIPWRVAFALQADGWWLRNAIVWAKRNPMPNSVTDRFSSTYEHVFLLTKAARYWFDLDAVREEHARVWDERNCSPANAWATGEKAGKVLGREVMPNSGIVDALPNPLGKNPGNCWSFPEEVHDLLTLAVETHAQVLGPKQFGDLAAFVGRVVDQLIDTSARVQSDGAGADAAVTNEAVADAVEQFLRTKPLQPNLVVFRGTPYATVTIEQSPDAISVEFGRNRWVCSRERLTGQNVERGEVVRHAFAVNGEGFDALLVLVNWVRGLPLPSGVLDQLRILRRQAYGHLLAAAPPTHNGTISNQEAEEIRHLRTGAAEVFLIESVLAVAIHLQGVSVATPSGVVCGTEAATGTALGASRNGACFHAPIIPLPIGQVNTTGDVWRIATKPTPYAHFATWPPDLVERMILAGCPPKVCAKCGEPWTIAGDTKWVTEGFGYVTACYCGTEHLIPQEELDADPTLLDDFEIEPPPPVPGVVLDPFAGSGTTTQVARKLGRRSIGIELNPAYEAVMRERLDLPTGGSLFADEDLGVEFVTLDVAEVTI
jgi:DNA modification methylase